MICKKGPDGNLHKMSKSKGNVVSPDELLKNMELIPFGSIRCLLAHPRKRQSGRIQASRVPFVS